MKVKINTSEWEWTYLPDLVFEKIFSYLCWKDRGTALLVCRRWYKVGGHPCLWARFPLQLDGQRLNYLPKIHRLGWVRSMTIILSRHWQIDDSEIERKKEEAAISETSLPWWIEMKEEEKN